MHIASAAADCGAPDLALRALLSLAMACARVHFLIFPATTDFKVLTGLSQETQGSLFPENKTGTSESAA